MPTEEQFVGLENAQIIGGKKNLLQAEMEILTALQKFESYKKLRKEELASKSILKKLVMETHKEMEIIAQYIPQIKIDKFGTEKMKSTTAKRDALEDEILEIRRKIAMLSTN